MHPLRLRRLVVKHLGALHGLGAVGDRLHELGYLLVFLGELGILDGKLVDDRGERGGICRIGLFCRISGVFLGGIRAYCSFNDFGCRLSFGFGNISYSICGFLLDSICSRLIALDCGQDLAPCNQRVVGEPAQNVDWLFERARKRCRHR